MIGKRHIRRIGVPPVCESSPADITRLVMSGNPPSPIRHRPSAFTLIEMLTVISIIGIIAALSVPVLKNFGKADVSISGSRQLLQDIGYARQLALAQRTTVYMVFLPTNFWNANWITALGNTNKTGDPNGLTEFTNLLDKQLVGYTYLTYGALGDQPGRHTWHYLAPWQALPQGTYISLWKFFGPNDTPAPSANPGSLYFSDPANPNNWFNISPFTYTNVFPFPSTNVTPDVLHAINPAAVMPFLPYIAFNYLGQLCNFSGQLLTSPTQGQDYDQDYVGGGVDIPLTQGNVTPGIDPNTRALVAGNAGVVETPLGNSTNISYNVIHIDPLTGRATLEYHKMQ